MPELHRFAIGGIAVCLSCWWWSCTPTPMVPPSPVTVCAHLRALACEEGTDGCEAALAHVRAARLMRIDDTCILAASTQEAVRLCDGIGPEGCP